MKSWLKKIGKKFGKNNTQKESKNKETSVINKNKITESEQKLNYNNNKCCYKPNSSCSGLME